MPRKAKALDPVDVQVGKKLRIIRELHQHSQQFLGDRIGVSRIKIGQYETGRSSIPSAMLYKLAKIYNIEINGFFDNEVLEEIMGDQALDNFFSKEIISIIRDFSSIDNNDVRKSFASVIERMVELSRK